LILLRKIHELKNKDQEKKRATDFKEKLHNFKAYLQDTPEKLSLSLDNKWNPRIMTLFPKLIRIDHAPLQNCFMFNQRTFGEVGGRKKRENIFERHFCYRHSGINLRYNSGAYTNLYLIGYTERVGL